MNIVQNFLLPFYVFSNSIRFHGNVRHKHILNGAAGNFSVTLLYHLLFPDERIGKLFAQLAAAVPPGQRKRRLCAAKHRLFRQFPPGHTAAAPRHGQPSRRQREPLGLCDAV